MFCTYITFYRGTLLPPFYIGYTSVDKIHKGYRGSVSSAKYRAVWQSELRNNPHLFKTVILRLYTTREQAKAAEENIQRKLSVVDNPLYTNLHIADSKFYGDSVSGQKAAATRRARGTNIPTKETIEKRANSNRGRTVSIATRLKIANKLRGRKRSPEMIAKVITARKASMAAKRAAL